MSMRFTIVAAEGTISFQGPGHVLKMLTAAMAEGSQTFRDALFHLEQLDDGVATSVRRDLSVFDEHCLPNDVEAIQAWLTSSHDASERAIRVIDPATRAISTQSGTLGLVIFNLGERRIVQVQNSYGRLMRADRGRIRRAGRPMSRFYRYELPDTWSIVP
jgi:hypothetical protein